MSGACPVLPKPTNLKLKVARGCLMAVVIFGFVPKLADASSACDAQGSIERYQLEIRRARLTDALKEFGEQTRLQIAHFSDVDPVNLVVGPLHGAYTREEALNVLLRGTGLTYRFVNDRTIAIVKESALPAQLAESKTPLADLQPESAAPDRADGGRGDKKPRENYDLNNKRGEQTKHRGLLTRILGMFTLCSAATVLSNPACAQAAGNANQPEATTPPTAALEEIIVTAQRRSESLERTPLAITALSADTLETRGISSANDLNQVVPGLAVSRTGISAQIGIRGVVSTNDTEVGDPAVAFNVDGVYLARSRGALAALFDIDRIEVLRGPQGTLYGRNATAGSINVITNRPDLDKASSSASIEYGNYNELQTFGMLNVPLDSTLAIRGAFQTDHHDGYSDNTPARPYQDLDSTAGRVEALWKPVEQLAALLSLEYYHDGGAGFGGYGATNPLGTYATGAGATAYRFAVSQDGYNNETTKGATLSVDWTLPIGATLSYVGNYRTDDWHSLSGSSAAGPTGAFCATATSADCRSNTFFSLENQTSHELRLGNGEGIFKWVAGLYYFKENNNVFLGITPIAGITSLAFAQPSVTEESKAAFGQATFSVTDRFRLTGGARYTQDHKGRIGETEAFGPIVGEQCVGCGPLNDNFADLKWSKTTWKGGAEFDVTADSMLYASVGTGYKAGGYGDGVAPNNNPYNPEDILAYDLGIKNDLLGHRLQVNVDSFYDLYTNYQASGLAVVSGQSSLVTINAGKAKIYGLELETASLLTDVDRLNLSVALLHAKFTQFDLLGDPFSAGPVSYTGNNLPNAPDVTVNLGYQHVFGLAGGATITPRADVTYVASQDLDYHNYDVTKQGAYTKTDLSLSYDSAKRTWRAMLYVHNLEDKAVLASAAPDPRATSIPIGQTSGFGSYLPPRTFGVKLSARF
jgi:iron complex outermembrane recepter protein